MPTLDEALQMAMNAHRGGNLDLAEGMYRQISEQAPNHPDAWHLLGVVANQRKDYARSAELIERAIRMHQHCGMYYANYGDTLRALGRLAEAEAALRHALELDPNHAEAWNNLGLVLRSLGRPQETIDAFSRALQLQPGRVEVLNNRSVLLQKVGRLQEALADLHESLRLDPNRAQTYNNLGGIFQELGQLTPARQAYEQAIQRSPTCAEALNNLGLLLLAQGEQEDALKWFFEAVRVDPENAGSFSNLLLCEQYRSAVSLPHLAAMHDQFDQRFGAPLRTEWKPFANAPIPDRVLKIGFVSADLYRHPIAPLVERVFLRMDRCEFQVYAYSNRVAEDDISSRLQNCVDVWRNVAGRLDIDVADEIRRDEIDLLFDLSGHTAQNRLLVFARKPAPIQISWLGYVGTTGLSAMDYLFTDETMVPPENDRFYRETVVRLPCGAACFTLPAELPPIIDPPMLKSGAITYGSFNNPAKITEKVIAAWSEILRRTPGSRLLLKFRGLDDGGTRDNFMNRFLSAGIEPGRVEYRGASESVQMLREYGEIDVALDPFPYNGGTTTMLALAMGVPVVTCPGETVASRQTFSVLNNIGFHETVAGNLDEYVRLAVSLATQPERLATWRPQLREQVLKAPFFDIDGWMPSFAQALRELWRRWCKAQSH